jgi:CBS domain containing-hemolysin-like protein
VTDVIAYVGCFLLALAAGALVAGMETAVVSLSASRLARLRNRGVLPAASAKTLWRILAQKERFLGAMLIGSIFCHVATAVSLAALAHRLLTTVWSAATAAIALSALYIFIVGQLAPKMWVRQRPMEFALSCWRLMSGAYLLTAPLAIFSSRISAVLVNLAGKVTPSKFTAVTREELKLLAPKPSAKSVAAVDPTFMIHGVIDMRQKTARDLMVPLSKVSTVSAAAGADDILALARTSGFSRLPVVESPSGAADPTLLGIVNVYDLLYAAENDPRKTARDFLRRPAILAESEPPDRALQKLRAARLPMGFVVNAQQQPIGIITVENIVTQIVGKTD